MARALVLPHHTPALTLPSPSTPATSSASAWSRARGIPLSRVLRDLLRVASPSEAQWRVLSAALDSVSPASLASPLPLRLFTLHASALLAACSASSTSSPSLSPLVETLCEVGARLAVHARQVGVDTLLSALGDVLEAARVCSAPPVLTLALHTLRATHAALRADPRRKRSFALVLKHLAPLLHCALLVPLDFEKEEDEVTGKEEQEGASGAVALWARRVLAEALAHGDVLDDYAASFDAEPAPTPKRAPKRARRDTTAADTAPTSLSYVRALYTALAALSDVSLVCAASPLMLRLFCAHAHLAHHAARAAAALRLAHVLASTALLAPSASASGKSGDAGADAAWGAVAALCHVLRVYRVLALAPARALAHLEPVLARATHVALAHSAPAAPAREDLDAAVSAATRATLATALLRLDHTLLTRAGEHALPALVQLTLAAPTTPAAALWHTLSTTWRALRQGAALLDALATALQTPHVHVDDCAALWDTLAEHVAECVAEAAEVRDVVERVVARLVAAPVAARALLTRLVCVALAALPVSEPRPVLALVARLHALLDTHRAHVSTDVAAHVDEALWRLQRHVLSLHERGAGTATNGAVAAPSSTALKAISAHVDSLLTHLCSLNASSASEEERNALRAHVTHLAQTSPARLWPHLCAASRVLDPPALAAVLRALLDHVSGHVDSSAGVHVDAGAPDALGDAALYECAAVRTALHSLAVEALHAAPKSAAAHARLVLCATLPLAFAAHAPHHADLLAYATRRIATSPPHAHTLFACLVRTLAAPLPAAPLCAALDALGAQGAAELAAALLRVQLRLVLCASPPATADADALVAALVPRHLLAALLALRAVVLPGAAPTVALAPAPLRALSAALLSAAVPRAASDADVHAAVLLLTHALGRVSHANTHVDSAALRAPAALHSLLTRAETLLALPEHESAAGECEAAEAACVRCVHAALLAADAAVAEADCAAALRCAEAALLSLPPTPPPLGSMLLARALGVVLRIAVVTPSSAWRVVERSVAHVSAHLAAAQLQAVLRLLVRVAAGVVAEARAEVLLRVLLLVLSSLPGSARVQLGARTLPSLLVSLSALLASLPRTSRNHGAVLAAAARVVRLREVPLSSALVSALLQAALPAAPLALEPCAHLVLALLGRARAPLPTAVASAPTAGASSRGPILAALPLVLRAVTALLDAALARNASGVAVAAGSAEEDALVHTLALVARVVGTLVDSLESALRKYAPYLLATLVQTLVRHALTVRARSEITRAVHALLSVCARHEHATLFATLAPSAQTLYRSLLAEHEREHRFKGKV